MTGGKTGSSSRPGEGQLCPGLWGDVGVFCGPEGRHQSSCLLALSLTQAAWLQREPSFLHEDCFGCRRPRCGLEETGGPPGRAVRAVPSSMFRGCSRELSRLLLGKSGAAAGGRWGCAGGEGAVRRSQRVACDAKPGTVSRVRSSEPTSPGDRVGDLAGPGAWLLPQAARSAPRTGGAGEESPLPSRATAWWPGAPAGRPGAAHRQSQVTWPPSRRLLDVLQRCPG